MYERLTPPYRDFCMRYVRVRTQRSNGVYYNLYSLDATEGSTTAAEVLACLAVLGTGIRQPKQQKRTTTKTASPLRRIFLLFASSTLKCCRTQLHATSHLHTTTAVALHTHTKH